MRTLAEIEVLRQRGHDVSLACSPDSMLGDRMEQAGVPVMRLRMSGARLYTSAPRIRRHIVRGRFTIVHVHSARDHLLGVLALLGVRGVSLVRTKHNTVPLKRGVFSRLLYDGLTDRLIAVSGATRDVLVADGVTSDKIVVIPDAVDTRRFSPRPKQPRVLAELGLSAEHFIVGCAARLGSKSVQARTLVRAFGKLAPRFRHARLLLVGHGSEGLVEEAMKLGISDRLIVPGFTEDMPAMLSVMDLFVQPNKKAGMGNALLEAMAMAKPIVATRVGGIPEAVVDGVTGRLCPPDDPGAMADTIAAVIEDPKALQEMGEKGRERAEKLFDRELVTDRIERVYAQLVNERSR